VTSFWKGVLTFATKCVRERGGESILPQNCVTSFMDEPPIHVVDIGKENKAITKTANTSMTAAKRGNVCCKAFVSRVARDVKFGSVAVEHLWRVLRTTQGRYKAANENFRQAVSMPLPQTNCGSIATATSSRVLYGVGRAHEMLARVRHYIRVATEPCLEHVLDWKDTRSDRFDSSVPTKRKSRSAS